MKTIEQIKQEFTAATGRTLPIFTFNGELGVIMEMKDEKCHAWIEDFVPFKKLDTDNIALGIAAGFTGNHLISLMNEQGIKNDFVLQNEGATRINVKLRADKEMDINAKGPFITAQSVSEF